MSQRPRFSELHKKDESGLAQSDSDSSSSDEEGESEEELDQLNDLGKKLMESMEFRMFLSNSAINSTIGKFEDNILNFRILALLSKMTQMLVVQKGLSPKKIQENVDFIVNALVNDEKVRRFLNIPGVENEVCLEMLRVAECAKEEEEIADRGVSATNLDWAPRVASITLSKNDKNSVNDFNKTMQVINKRPDVGIRPKHDAVDKKQGFVCSASNYKIPNPDSVPLYVDLANDIVDNLSNKLKHVYIGRFAK